MADKFDGSSKVGTYKFPDGFLWGAGTSAFQVEGGIENNWSVWLNEKANDLAENAHKEFGKLPSWDFIKNDATNPENYIPGKCAEFEKRYESDLDLAKEIGHNANRFSIEWSRVEPRDGEYDQGAIDFYKKLAKAITNRGMTPMVTLWWWTDPLWITKNGGWENIDTVRKFSRYVEKISFELKDSGIKFWQPLNEPGVPVGMGYVYGAHPPQVKSLWRANRVFKNLMSGYRDAYKIIHKNVPNSKVGLSHYARHMIPGENRMWNIVVVKLMDYYRGWRFLDSLKDHLDFIGLQYYKANIIRLNFFRKGFIGPIHEQDDFTKTTDMGWSMYPEGLYFILKKAAKYGKDIYISENGIADVKDESRSWWIEQNLRQIKKALSEGVPVKGYFHWSLIDNFEWDKGFWPRFGLIEVDYKTQERKIRPSAYVYKKIIENGLDGLE